MNNVDEIEKVSIEQFSNKNGGHILILVMNTLYIFNREGTEEKTVDLSQKINGDHYGLTPYKKEDKQLIFIISYIESSNIIVKKYEFNLESEVINITNIIEKNIIFVNLKGVCILLVYETIQDGPK